MVTVASAAKKQGLADFAQTARDEVEMEALTGELLRVVQETMQPVHLGIWIKTTKTGVSSSKLL